ncbi:putative reverse transcriptase domain-containing protein [Tanacetum coccineum]
MFEGVRGLVYQGGDEEVQLGVQGEDENAEDVQMADHLRPMEELLQIPIIGIEDAIVVPAVLANEFELKIELLDFISNNPLFGLENDDPHSHIKRFYQITQTFKINQVSHDVVKLILFSFSLKGAAETWLKNEPPCSITTWDDLVSKFLNRFYPHSKTRELRKEIMNFQQVFGETFTEAWERFKDLLRKCPHHGFSPLHQIDFFYNGLSQSDQDSLNTAAGGNLMSKNTQEALTIIENKAKVRTFEVLEYHIASMRETYDHNQEAAIQLMQNQMGQMAEAFQERPLCVLPSNTKTNPLAELNVITSMDGLTLDGSFIPHSNFLVYQEEEQEPETITEVVEISSSQSTPLVPPPIDIVDSMGDKFSIENNSLSGNPTPSSDSVVESLSPLLTPFEDSDSLSEETDTLLSHSNNSLPYNETFCFDIEEKSSGSTTSHSDHYLSNYEAFCFDVDHIEEKSSGSTTSHFDLSLLEYESFHFYFLINQLIAENVCTEKMKTLIFSLLEKHLPRLLIACETELINMINFIDITCEDRFDEVLKIQKSIHCLSGSPTPSDLVVDSLVEETDILLSHFNDSSPDYEIFCFDIEEKSSGSTTSHSYHSLLEYESFCFDVDHIKEKSSGSTTSYSDLSLLEYESFHFDLLTDQLPPVDRSNFYHKEFADELAHIISPPEYDHFYFDLEDDPGELTRLLKKNISETLTKDLKINELNDFPFFLSDCDSIFSEKFSEIDLLVLFPSGDKDKVFDPGIFTINGVHSKRFSILLLDDFSSILFVSDSLLLIDPSEIDTFLSFSSRNEDKVFDPGILLNNGIFSFTRKSSHLLIDNFMIDNCHILSEISLKIVSSISFHPKDKTIRGESS